MADDDQRLAGDLGAQVVARIRQLRVVADVVPGVGEEVLLLEREQLFVDVEIAVHAIGLHQCPHGGRVAAESEGPGRGATFRVWLPLHRATEFSPREGAGSATPRSLVGMRVLLVDDAPDTLETFGYLLEHEGAVVTPASSGAEALRLAATADFDLLVSDVGMPQMDGYEMIAQMRGRPRTTALPAIALTGYGREQDVQRALSAGFNAHVDKPVDFTHMCDVMKAVLAGAPLAGSACGARPKE